jgi:hypothetical protein
MKFAANLVVGSTPNPPPPTPVWKGYNSVEGFLNSDRKYPEHGSYVHNHTLAIITTSN